MRLFVRVSAFILLTVVVISAASSRARYQDKDTWQPLQFLIGNWTGGGSGKPGEGISGIASFAFDLDKKIIVRKNRAEIPPKPGEAKGAAHEDLMIIYPQQGSAAFKAVYFDSEGHVINYTVTTPSQSSTAVFESDPNEKGPRFRLTYAPGSEGTLNTEFFISPPGGEFKSYVKGSMKRTR